MPFDFDSAVAKGGNEQGKFDFASATPLKASPPSKLGVAVQLALRAATRPLSVEAATRPLIPLPAASELPPYILPALAPGSALLPPDIAAAGYNVAKPVVEFGLSPAGIGLALAGPELGATALGRLGLAATGVGFGVPITKQGAEELARAEALRHGYDPDTGQPVTPTRQQLIEAYGAGARDLIMGPLMAVGGAVGAKRAMAPAPKPPPPILPAPKPPTLISIVDNAAKKDISPAQLPQVLEAISTPSKVAAPTTPEANWYNKFLAKAVRRSSDETAGQYILDVLDERGISPRQVVQEFWDQTYPKLPREVQQRFEKYIRKETDFKPGDIIGTRTLPDGTKQQITANSWPEVYPPEAMGGKMDQLEGTERGLIALMGQANEARAQLKVQPQPALSGPTPTPQPSKFLEAEKAALIQAAIKKPGADYLYSVQRPQEAGGKTIPGYIQVDVLSKGAERPMVSSNVKDLNAAGADIPEVPEWLPQGQYTLTEIQQAIKEGKPHANRIPAPVYLDETQQAANVSRMAAGKPGELPLTPGPQGEGGGGAPAPQIPPEGVIPRPPQPPPPTIAAPPPLPPKQRGFSERMALAEPNPEIKAEIAANPAERYTPQENQPLADQMATLDDATLWQKLKEGGTPAPEGENAGTLAGAELYQRASAELDPAIRRAKVKAVREALSQKGTTFAQLLQQYSEIKTATPEGLTAAVLDEVERHGRKATEEQEMHVLKLASDQIGARDGLAQAERDAKSAWNDKTQAAYEQAFEEAGKAKKALAMYAQTLSTEKMLPFLARVIPLKLMVVSSQVANFMGNLMFGPFRNARDLLATGLDAMYSKVTGAERTHAYGLPQLYAEWGQTLRKFPGAFQSLIKGPSNEAFAKYEMQRGFQPLRSIVQAWTGEDMAVDLKTGQVLWSDRARKLVQGLMGVDAEVMARCLDAMDKPFREGAGRGALSEQARLNTLELNRQLGAANELVRRGEEVARANPTPENQKALTTLKANVETIQGKLAKYQEPQIGQFYAFPGRKEAAAAKFAGAKAVFAQPNKGITKLNALLDSGVAEMIGADRVPMMKDAIRLFNKIQIPFRQFPINYVSDAFSFTVPPYGIARALYHAAKGNQRAALSAISEATIGAMMYAGTNYLWDKGLISEPASKDAKRRSVQYEQMGPSRLNISGLERLTSGGDPTWKRGDYTIAWNRLGIPAVAFYLRTTQLARQRQEELATVKPGQPLPLKTANLSPGEYAYNTIASFPGMAQFALDQTFMSGVSSLLEAVKNSDETDSTPVQQWISNQFRAVSALAVPNTVEELARTRYKFIPELRGDTTMQTMANMWNFKMTGIVGGAEKVVPLVKRGLWGEPLERTPPGTSPALYNLGITKGGITAPDPFKQRLVELWQKTEDDDVYPTPPNRGFAMAGQSVQLERADLDRLQELVGTARRSLTEPFVMSAQWTPLTPQMRIMVLDELYQKGAQIGRAQFLMMPGMMQKYFGGLFGQPQEVQPKGRSAKAAVRESMMPSPAPNPAMPTLPPRK